MSEGAVTVDGTGSEAGRQDPEGRALAGPAVDGELAAERADDAERDGQAEARADAARLGREEGVEDAGHDLGRDAGAVVLDLDDDEPALVEAADADDVALRGRLVEGLGRVEDDVEEDLPEPGLVGAHGLRRAEVTLDARAVLDLVAQHRQGRLDRDVDVERGRAVVVDVRERSEIAHDAVDARHALLRFLEDRRGLEEDVGQAQPGDDEARAARGPSPAGGAGGR